MARPQKCRRVCKFPKYVRFSAETSTADTVVMTVDEYEVVRLIDYQNLTQEECSLQIKVARTTVQGIYFSARRKIADVLVNGKTLIIDGGEYELCNYRGKCNKVCDKRCKRNIEKGENDDGNSSNA